MTSRHVVNLIWVNYRRGTPIPTLLPQQNTAGCAVWLRLLLLLLLLFHYQNSVQRQRRAWRLVDLTVN